MQGVHGHWGRSTEAEEVDLPGWISRSTALLIRFGSRAWQALSKEAMALPKIFCV